MRALLAVASGLAFAACSGSTSTHTCSGMVSGALTGTFSVCNDYDERYRANLDSWELTAAYTELPTSFTLSTDWVTKGEPAKKTYEYNGDPNVAATVTCNITAVKGVKQWLARAGAGIPSSGNCHLTISDITPNDAMGNVTTYQLKGSIAAHLEADPAKPMTTGTVDVTMDFCEGDAASCPAPMR